VVFQRITTEPPLPSRNVYSIEQDKSGLLWLSTGNGLVRLDPKTLKITIFTEKDGLQGKEFDQTVSLKDTAGWLYFGGGQGFNRFNPEMIVDNDIPPVMRFTDVIIAGEPLSYDIAYEEYPELTLTHEDYLVDVQFSVLDFIDAPRNRYKYRLENFDRDWVDIGERHNASFTNLPAGSYTLRVIGANSKGVWNSEGISMAITVLPAPWLTWWAFTFYGLSVVALLGLLKTYYDNHVLKHKATELAARMKVHAERAMDDLEDQLDLERRLVLNIHQHTDNTLQIIAQLLAQQAETIDDETILEGFTDNQQRLRCLRLLETCLYYSGEVLEVNFKQYVDALLGELLAGTSRPNMEIIAINDSTDARIPASTAIPAAIITNELITNSIKHAFEDAVGVQTVRVYLHETSDMRDWILEVADTGIGLPNVIDPMVPTTMGMEIVNHFAKQLGASIKVNRVAGTCFRFDFPRAT